MGVLEKIKNALFEVEYVEVDEPPKKEKKAKFKNKNKINTEEKHENVVEKPIAKKIVLPGRKEEKVEKLEEEELVDDNFEARPIDETVKENLASSFKYMDDDDFKVEDEYENSVPEIVKVIDEDEDAKSKAPDEERYRPAHSYDDNYKVKEDNFEAHYGINKYPNNKESKPYGLDKSLSVQVHEYGTYDRKEEKSGFKPSPIISPIYGILDKNYKKEDVVQKKEIRLSSSYSRGNLNVDAVRNKAYGDIGKKEEASIKKESTPITFEVDEDDDDNLLVDLSDDKDRPEVKEITMGDALEYFQDLGLEYNVDYVDASKEKNAPKKEREDFSELDLELKENIEDTKDDEKVDEVNSSSEEEEKIKTVEIKDESNGSVDVTLDDDDNLFDLIDSMYQESD